MLQMQLADAKKKHAFYMENYGERNEEAIRFFERSLHDTEAEILLQRAERAALERRADREQDALRSVAAAKVHGQIAEVSDALVSELHEGTQVSMLDPRKKKKQTCAEQTAALRTYAAVN